MILHSLRFYEFPYDSLGSPGTESGSTDERPCSPLLFPPNLNCPSFDAQDFEIPIM